MGAIAPGLWTLLDYAVHFYITRINLAASARYLDITQEEDGLGLFLSGSQWLVASPHPQKEVGIHAMDKVGLQQSQGTGLRLPALEFPEVGWAGTHGSQLNPGVWSVGLVSQSSLLLSLKLQGYWRCGALRGFREIQGSRACGTQENLLDHQGPSLREETSHYSAFTLFYTVPRYLYE